MSYSDIDRIGGSGWEQLLACLSCIPKSAYLQLQTCYRLTVSPSWSIRDRVNEDLHLLLVRGGRGEYHIAEKRIPLRRGMILFVGAGVRHEAFPDSTDLPQITPVRFRFAACDSSRRKLQQPSFAFQLKDVEMNRFEPLFHQLWQSAQSKMSFENAISASLLCLIFQEIVRTRNAATGDPRITRLCKWIEQNPTSRATVSELAVKVRLCPRQLNRLFQEQTGLSPLLYLIHARLAYAQKLLQETSNSVKEIAAELAYPDEFTFSRQFKKMSGCSPTAFRRQTQQF